MKNTLDIFRPFLLAALLTGCGGTEHDGNLADDGAASAATANDMARTTVSPLSQCLRTNSLSSSLCGGIDDSNYERRHSGSGSGGCSSGCSTHRGAGGEAPTIFVGVFLGALALCRRGFERRSDT